MESIKNKKRERELKTCLNITREPQGEHFLFIRTYSVRSAAGFLSLSFLHFLFPTSTRKRLHVLRFFLPPLATDWSGWTTSHMDRQNRYHEHQTTLKLRLRSNDMRKIITFKGILDGSNSSLLYVQHVKEWFCGTKPNSLQQFLFYHQETS